MLFSYDAAIFIGLFFFERLDEFFAAAEVLKHGTHYFMVGDAIWHAFHLCHLLLFLKQVFFF